MLRQYTPRLPLADRLLSKLDRSGDCWIFTGARTRQGYGMLNVDKKSMRTHVVAYQVWIGPIPKGMCVCHTCDNPPCCNPAHLWLGTHTENMQDMVRKGRYSRAAVGWPERHPEWTLRGERQGRSKLKETDIPIIRSLRGVVPLGVLAERFGVSKVLISMVQRGVIWKHI